MKTSTLERNGVSTEIVELIGRLIDLMAWPTRRRAMGDVTMTLLDGKRRVAEEVFGWNRKAVELGIHEYQTGIACINDISARGKPKTEDKHPMLLAEIQAIMEPHSESESSLRTTDMARIPRPPPARRPGSREALAGGRGIRAVGLNRLAQTARLCKLDPLGGAGG